MQSGDLKKFVSIPTISTERLILRKINARDINDVFEYASDKDVPKYLLWEPHKNKFMTKIYLSLVENKYRRAEFYDWGIEYQGKMIGTCGFTSFSVENNVGELGYVLNKNYWGLGIATEAAARVMQFGFVELGLNRIESRIMKENESSKRVIEKLGMSFEGLLRESVFAKGEYKDVMIYSITAREYFSKA